jgi:mRNA interferase RelE/StbE
MVYKLEISDKTIKDLKKLDKVVQKRIVKKIKFFMNEADPLQFSKTLVNSKDGDYRWRIGNFRVVFDVDGNKIKLLRIQHRKDVYGK